MVGRWWCVSVAVLGVWLWAGVGAAAASLPEEPGARADSLFRRARERFSSSSPDARRQALDDFEAATRLEPAHADIWFAYGQACLESGRFQSARTCFSRVARLLPKDPVAWSTLGQAWKHDWLATLERSSLDEALDCFRRASEAAPDRAADWSAVAALELLRGRPREGLAAALHARRADPEAAEPLLVLGAALYRLSVLSYADSAFRAARPRLPAALLARLDGDLVSGTGPDTISAAGATSAASPWRDSDPDLTTPENEAQLDYLTRLALALFLFREADKVRWDMRAELFLRYGPPASVEYDPAWAQLGAKELEFHFPRPGAGPDAVDPMPYPYNMQVWHYPDLGMDVTLLDRHLTQDYELPYSSMVSADPRPDPATLAARSDLVGVSGGRGVFRAMAPGVKAMPVTGSLSRFPLAAGARLLAHVFAAGEPLDSLWGSWALVDETGHVVARESHGLAISACDPTRLQVGDFAANVPPGDYRVDLAVRGARGQRGVAHLRVHLDPIPAGLSMSDLLLLCGSRPTSFGPEGVRIEPSLRRHVSGSRPAIFYYELERLATRADGSARFSYTYSVRSTREEEEGRAPRAAFEATREEENVGPHRRQFVTVPLARLTPGPYELRIEVRDLVGGATVSGSLEFVKD